MQRNVNVSKQHEHTRGEVLGRFDVTHHTVICNSCYARMKLVGAHKFCTMWELDESTPSIEQSRCDTCFTHLL